MSACKLCHGRGWWFAWKVGRETRELINGDCKHCGGTGDTVGQKFRMDDKLIKALDWFKTSTPPSLPFKMWRWKISKPAMFWGMVKADLESKFDHEVHRCYPEIVKLFDMFGTRKVAPKKIDDQFEDVPWDSIK